ncbi:MAG: SMI1/KNR4 family protein [Planctomycetota bacterium]|nr:SMI1/KNR4 family protein [Planctomycetota bacterium]
MKPEVGGIPGFVRRGPELAEADVAALEVRLATTLPADYRAFLLATDGGRAHPNVIDVLRLHGGEAEIKSFLGVGRPVRSSSIEWKVEVLSGRLESNWLPIADDSFGNAYCL